MAGMELKQMELSQNYRSSDRIIGYFANYIEHAMEIFTASRAPSTTP